MDIIHPSFGLSPKQPEKLTVSDLLDPETLMTGARALVTIAREGTKGALHAGLQNPVSGITEIADKCLGTNLLPQVQFIELDRPKTDLEKGARMAGSVVGTIAPLILAHKVVGKLATDLSRTEVGAQFSHLLENRTARAYATVLSSEMLLRPTDSNDYRGFVEQKLGNATTGVLTLAVLQKTSGALRASNLGAKMSPFGLNAVGAAIENKVGSATLAGLPAGMVHAHMTSLFQRGRLASLSEAASTAGGLAITGGLLARVAPLGETPGPVQKNLTLPFGMYR